MLGGGVSTRLEVKLAIHPYRVSWHILVKRRYKPVSLDQINQRLISYVPRQLKPVYTLDRMRDLMNSLGNPQDSLRIIHVAGTSGKTSTAYYAASFLKQAGYIVGLTVSPHIVKVSERAQINLETLTDDEFSATMNEFLDQVDTFELYPTYFEVLIAFAYWFFYKQGVDFAIIEVGLGGLLDGTNVINRKDKYCIITDIGLDHTEILGDTVEAIAAQKAGIIHSDNHVWMNRQSDSIESVIIKRCSGVGAYLSVIDDIRDKAIERKFELLPSFQRRNSTLAYSAVCAILGHPLKPLQIANALNIIIAGRMEVFHCANHTVILDGAHNEQKIAALVKAIQSTYAGKKIQLVVSFGQNKSSSVDRSLELLSALSNSIIFTEFSLGQDTLRTAINAVKLSERRKKFDYISVERIPERAFRQALTKDRPIVVVVGSFYLLNHVRPLLVTNAELKH
jgi:dihydrofolate synthase/folylpolyglutamate synthase